MSTNKVSWRFAGLAVMVLICLWLWQGRSSPAAAQGPQPGGPDVLRLIGPVSMDKDLRTLPDVPATNLVTRPVLTRHGVSSAQTESTAEAPTAQPAPNAPAPSIPAPTLTFTGVTRITSGCGCLPPDTNGDVGPNHYIQTVNTSFEIFNKSGLTLSGPTTFNSLWLGAGTGTPCDTTNQGDPVVFYDSIANRWVLTDFAFPVFPGTSFYECIAVSKTSDPVAGGWWLYGLQVDPAHPSYLGDYPKFGLWPDGYYLTVNMFSDGSTFNGVRVYALDRAAMINGTGAPAPTVVAFTILPADLGDTYSLLPATFRYGGPPVGRDEFFAAVDSPATGGVTLNTVHVWKFHVDFTTPALSTFGLGAGHTPNADVAVNNFVDAFTNTTSRLVPQMGTTSRLDTLGDKLMANLWYRNRFGSESLWATQTVSGTNHTGIRWYQFKVSGGTIATTPVQQQTFDNSNDGLFRWMPSGAIDNDGNFSVGYSVSSSSMFPDIRYAGRLNTDLSNTLAQGEATMTAGGGSQTSSTSGRWGDYSSMSPDPVVPCTFWYTQEYYSASSSSTWSTRIGTFAFPQGQQCIGPTAVTVDSFEVKAESELARADIASAWPLAVVGLVATGVALFMVVRRRRG